MYQISIQLARITGQRTPDEKASVELSHAVRRLDRDIQQARTTLAQRRARLVDVSHEYERRMQALDNWNRRNCCADTCIDAAPVGLGLGALMGAGGGLLLALEPQLPMGSPTAWGSILVAVSGLNTLAYAAVSFPALRDRCVAGTPDQRQRLANERSLLQPQVEKVEADLEVLERWRAVFCVLEGKLQMPTSLVDLIISYEKDLPQDVAAAGRPDS
jgi:hypothetical protein